MATEQPAGSAVRIREARRAEGMSAGQRPGWVSASNIWVAWYGSARENAGVIKPFLRAHWSHLCVISYDVPEELLTPYLPRGLTLDMREGKCFASLVAFDFENARVKGIAWPGFREFPEVNLRFYARRGSERGVVFVREYVPSRVVSWVARRVYNEPYERAAMTSRIHHTMDGLEVKHTLEREGKKSRIIVSATKEPPLLPESDGWESFFIDQEWGFGKGRLGETVRYRVVHPRWLVYKVEWAEVHVDWARLYGGAWACLKGRKPCSTILAEGSEVAVFPAQPV